MVAHPKKIMAAPRILRQSHTTVYVLDHEEALVFYRDLLGFEVRMDVTGEDGFRWLAVGPVGQPDWQLVLAEIRPGPMMTAETAAQLKDFVRQGLFGIGVFETNDCQGMYEALSAKGVTFLQAPTKQFYGLEALVRDNSGNWFSLTERQTG